MAIRLGTLVAELGQADTGINHAVRGVVRTHAGDLEAYVKRLEDPREILVEILCALLARNEGLPVPEPLLVMVPEHLGGPQLAYGSATIGHLSLGAFITTAPNTASSVLERLRAWKHLLPAACFDEWIANCDRHAQNLLFSGNDEFWLIDHGLAIHNAIPVDALAPQNQLFELVVGGKTEGDLLMLRPKAMGVMESYSQRQTADVMGRLPKGVWSEAVLDSVFSWLSARQNHLVRLASARIPARQSEMFDGRQY